MVLLSVLVNYNIRYNCWSVLCKMSIPLPMQSKKITAYIARFIILERHCISLYCSLFVFLLLIRAITI